MYHLDHLFTLLTIEKARELQLRPDHPPVIVSEREERPLQGPPTSRDEVLGLLRNLATSRQMRDLTVSGSVQFVNTTRGRAPFLIRAHMADDQVMFDIS